MRKSKTLLILGNGADLHLGYKTKWTDYWDWRREQIISDKDTEIAYQETICSLKSNLDYDVFREDKIDVPKNVTAEDRLYIKKIEEYIQFKLVIDLENLPQSMHKDVVIACSRHSKTEKVNEPVTEYDIIFAWLAIIPMFNDSKVNKSDLLLWSNVEMCIDVLVTGNHCGDLDGHEFDFIEGVVELINRMSKVNLFGDDIIKYFVMVFAFIHTRRELDEIDKATICFETKFKEYICSELNNHSSSKNDLANLVDKIGSYSESSEMDILDFNYEMISDCDFGNCLSANVKSIMQPHGNILKGVIIGGNYDIDTYASRRTFFSSDRVFLNDDQKSKSLAKQYRSKVFIYDSNKILSLSDYAVDLNVYDQIVIYGWSVNNIDEVLFKNKDSFVGNVSCFVYGGPKLFGKTCNVIVDFVPNLSSARILSDSVLN